MGLHAAVTASFTAQGAETFTVDVEFEVERGESLVVLGPSGSGKTLLLETVAGFHAHEGTVELDGRRLDGVPPERREFGFVFQDYALFPHMSVRENVEYGTRYHDETRGAGELLAELDVGHLVDRYPPTLSGGEKQRVALARALAVRPEVLLLDEPLAALDVPTRQSLREDLVDVLADVTTVYVTHNRTTARAIADRIGVMREGRIVQLDGAEAVFERPANRFVAEFTGANCLALADGDGLAEALEAPPGATRAAIRPEHVRLDGGSSGVPGEVERVVREDGVSRVTVSVDGTTAEALTPDPPAVGEEVAVSFPAERVTFL